MRILPWVLCALLTASGCDHAPDVTSPSFGGSSLLASALPLSAAALSRLEGIYCIEQGGQDFGDTAVIRYTGRSLSIFTAARGTFMTIEAGQLDTVIVLEGKWRYSLNTLTGLVRLQINAGTGGAYLLGSPVPAVPLVAAGGYGLGSGLPSAPLVLRFVRAFSDRVRRRPFWILAHRGGGRNSDQLGASENSLQLIAQAEGRGASGIEVDVHLTSDGVPFLYHDEDLNLRLVREGVLWGPVEAYTWPQLRSLVRLTNGEQVPSLEEALDFVVRHTGLALVWLDMKSDRNQIPVVAALQQKYLQLARQLGRPLEILIGLPTDEVFGQFLQYRADSTLPALCELNLDQVRQADARVWAPRWTLGTLNSDVEAMHAEGRRVFTWTVDEPAYVERFLTEGNFDGMLSNYPPVVAYYHYRR